MGWEIRGECDDPSHPSTSLDAWVRWMPQEFQVTRDNCFLRDSHSAPESRRGATSFRRGVSLNTAAAVQGRPWRKRYSRTLRASALLVNASCGPHIHAEHINGLFSHGRSFNWRQSDAVL